MHFSSSYVQPAFTYIYATICYIDIDGNIKMFVVIVLCLLVSCIPNGKIYNSKPYIATINLKQNDNVCFSHLFPKP